MNTKACLIAICLSILLPSLGVAALQLSPPIQELDVKRGRSTTFEFNVYNDGDEEVLAVFSVHDMDIDETGKPFVANDSTYARGAANWITLEQESAHIGPVQGMVLSGTVTVPRDAEGGYYAMLKVTAGSKDMPIDISTDQGETGLEMKLQVAVLLMFTVESRRNAAVLYPDTIIVYPNGEKAELENQSLLARSEQSKGWELKIPIRNSGNTHTMVRGSVGLWSGSGMRLETLPLTAGKGYIIPNRARDFKATGVGALVDGYYLLSIALQTREGRNISEEFPFEIRDGQTIPNVLVDETAQVRWAARPAFRFRDPVLRKTVTPGGSTYIVANLQSIALDTIWLQPETIDWSIDPRGNSYFSPAGVDHGRSALSWLEQVDDEIVLPPRHSTTVKLRVEAPETLDGEYYAALSLIPKGLEPALAEEFRGARTQLIILTGPETGESEVSIDTIYVHKDPDTQKCIFDLSVENNGTKYCFVSGIFALERENNPGAYDIISDRVEFGGRDQIILPNGRRNYSLNIPELKDGKYRATFYITYDSDEGSLYRKTRVFVI